MKHEKTLWVSVFCGFVMPETWSTSLSMKIPGLNAPIPPGGSQGYHPGGWGKPPFDEVSFLFVFSIVFWLNSTCDIVLNIIIISF